MERKIEILPAVTASSFICYIIAKKKYGVSHLIVNTLQASGADIRDIWLLC